MPFLTGQFSYVILLASRPPQRLCARNTILFAAACKASGTATLRKKLRKGSASPATYAILQPARLKSTRKPRKRRLNDSNRSSGGVQGCLESPAFSRVICRCRNRTHHF